MEGSLPATSRAICPGAKLSNLDQPSDDRSKWNLPKNYQMVAPAYAEARSNLAKKTGLGQGGRRAKAPAPNKGGRSAKARV